jgi:DNA-binding NarL/FixJ family response regulator
MDIQRRILVVDDEPMVAALLASVLTSAGFATATAADALEMNRQIDAFDPDALLLDISLGDGPSGLDLGHALSLRRPDIAVLYLSRYPDPRLTGRGRERVPEGSGYLHKDRIEDVDYLIASIEAVLRGNPENASHAFAGDEALAALSPKHGDVLRLLALGYTNEYIARSKDVAVGTVERWNNEIFEALGIARDGDTNRRVEAVRRYVAAVGLPPKP